MFDIELTREWLDIEFESLFRENVYGYMMSKPEIFLDDNLYGIRTFYKLFAKNVGTIEYPFNHEWETNKTYKEIFKKVEECENKLIVPILSNDYKCDCFVEDCEYNLKVTLTMYEIDWEYLKRFMEASLMTYYIGIKEDITERIKEGKRSYTLEFEKGYFIEYRSNSNDSVTFSIKE